MVKTGERLHQQDSRQQMLMLSFLTPIQPTAGATHCARSRLARVGRRDERGGGTSKALVGRLL